MHVERASRPKRQPKVYLEPLRRRDIPRVLEIEEMSFPVPWSRAELLRLLRQPNCTGIAVKRNRRVVGYFIFDIIDTRVELIRIAVTPACRRQGIGRLIIDSLVAILSPDHWTTIALVVRERNLPAQLFFRSCGFRVTHIMRRAFPETDEDAYVMEYRASPHSERVTP